MQQYCDHCNDCYAISVCCVCGEPLITYIIDDDDDSGYTSDDVSDDEIDNVYPL